MGQQETIGLVGFVLTLIAMIEMRIRTAIRNAMAVQDAKNEGFKEAIVELKDTTKELIGTIGNLIGEFREFKGRAMVRRTNERSEDVG